MSVNLTPYKRLERFAAKQTGAFNHIHTQNGRAYACNTHRIYSMTSDKTACTCPDCNLSSGLDTILKSTQKTAAIIEVTHTHLKRAVKLAAAMYSGRTQQDSRESKKEVRRITLNINGALEVSAESDYGRTITRLEDGQSWHESFVKSKGEYKTSEVIYTHVGDNLTAHFDAGVLDETLMLFQSGGADKLTIEFWPTSLFIGATIKAGEVEAVLAGLTPPEDSTEGS